MLRFPGILNCRSTIYVFKPKPLYEVAKMLPITFDQQNLSKLHEVNRAARFNNHLVRLQSSTKTTKRLNSSHNTVGREVLGATNFSKELRTSSRVLGF